MQYKNFVDIRCRTSGQDDKTSLGANERLLLWKSYNTHNISLLGETLADPFHLVPATLREKKKTLRRTMFRTLATMLPVD